MQMLYKPANDFVQVYSFFPDKTALIYSGTIQSFKASGGWEKVPVASLYPLTQQEYKEKIKDYQQKYLEIEQKILKLGDNIYVTSDSLTFNNLDDAIKHEKSLI